MSKNSDSYAIAQRYTTALFELAEEKKKLKPLAAELEALQTLLSESDDFTRLCEDPTIGSEEMHKALYTLTKKAKSSPILKNFLTTLADNGRMEVLPEVLQDFARRIYAKNDQLVAEVTSAAPMKKAQQTKLEKMLKDHFGKKVALEIHVNKSLLGGLRIRVDGQLIDASISGRMQRLESHLNAGIQQIV